MAPSTRRSTTAARTSLTHTLRNKDPTGSPESSDDAASDIPAERPARHYSPSKDVSLYQRQPHTARQTSGDRPRKRRAQPSFGSSATKRRPQHTASVAGRTENGAGQFMGSDDQGVPQNPLVHGSHDEDDDSRLEPGWLRARSGTHGQPVGSDAANQAIKVERTVEEVALSARSVEDLRTLAASAVTGHPEEPNGWRDAAPEWQQRSEAPTEPSDWEDLAENEPGEIYAGQDDEAQETRLRAVKEEGSLFVSPLYDSDEPQPEWENEHVEQIPDRMAAQTGDQSSSISADSRSSLISEAGIENSPTTGEPLELSSTIERQQSNWDDPRYFDPPAASENVALAAVRSETLDSLMTYMGHAAWTGGGKKWHAELCSGKEIAEKAMRQLRLKRNLSQEDIDARLWYEKHQEAVKTTRCKGMLRYIHGLWRLCRKIPTAANIDEQADCLRQEETVVAFRQDIHAIESYVNSLTTQFAAMPDDPAEGDMRWARGTAKSLCRRIIPLLLLVLKEVFITGSPQSRQERVEEELDALPKKADFSASLLQTMIRITGWVQKLYACMVDELQLRPLKSEKEMEKMMRHRYFPKKYIEQFKRSITDAWTGLHDEANVPMQRQLAIENDRRLKQGREQEQRKLREAEDRQMQLHLASTQRMVSRRSSSQSAFLPSSPALQTLPRARHLTEEDYAAHNGGWCWDEDDQLLTALRRVQRPDFTVLAGMLRDRSSSEVKQRAIELKEMSRRKYEGWGMVPPEWCQP